MVKKYSVKKSYQRENRQVQPKAGGDSSQGGDFDPFFFDTDNFNHAGLLQDEGKSKLENGEIEGAALLEAAANLDPENHELLFQQGLSLLQYGIESKKKKYLLLANKKFNQAVKLNQDHTASWQSWGKSFAFLGETFGDHHFFLEAKKRYEQAIEHSQGISGECAAEIHWDYGKIMARIAEHSGEVSDYYRSLDAHAKASQYREDLPSEFWKSFGRTSLNLGLHINDTRFYYKAINCHKNAISHSLSDFESWYLLGYSLMQLYYVTHDEDHFCQANECFADGAKLNPQNADLWAAWAKLLLSSGVRLKDVKRLHSCIEKCHRGYTLHQNSEKILSIWARALAALGLHSERLELMQDALNKHAEATEKFGQTLELSFTHGSILFAKGEFFKDLDYYYQAIEKFQEGLSIDRTSHKLWFHLGYTYSITAEMENDSMLYERAVKFFNRAIALQTRSTYLYEYAKTLAKLADVERDRPSLEKALMHYEQAFSLQKNAAYVHPQWLFQYGVALDLMGDFADEDQFYVKAVEVLSRVLVLDPDFPDIHYQIGLVYSHLGELVESGEIFERAMTHFKIAAKENEENELILLDWALAIINLCEMSGCSVDREQLMREAEYKLIQSAKLGASEAYYHLSSLYSILRQFDKSLYFLEKSESFGALPAIDEILEDDWMENLRQTELFQSFLAHLESRQNSKAEDF